FGPPCGFCELTKSPGPRAEAQAVLAHEMLGKPTGLLEEPTWLDCQAEAPPVGLVVVTTSPPMSTAAQSEGLEHETDVRALAVTRAAVGVSLVSTTLSCQLGLALVGFVETKA